MNIKYGMGANNNVVEYEAETEEIKEVIKDELNNMSKEEIIELIYNVFGLVKLADYFEPEIKDAFQDKAEEMYKYRD